MYALPIDQSGLAGFIPTERQPNRRQRRAMYAMQPRQRRMPRRIQLPRGLMGGGIIPVIGRLAGGGFGMGNSDTVTADPMYAIDIGTTDIGSLYSDIDQTDTDIGQILSANQETNIGGGPESIVAGQEPEPRTSGMTAGFMGDESYPSPTGSSSSPEVDLTNWDVSWEEGIVTPWVTQSDILGGVLSPGKITSKIASRAINTGLSAVTGAKAASILGPGVGMLTESIITGKPPSQRSMWTTGLQTIAALAFPPLVPIIGLISFLIGLFTDEDEPTAQKEAEAFVSQYGELPPGALPTQLARSGLGVGFTPDILSGEGLAFVDENVDLGRFTPDMQAELAAAMEAQDPYSESFARTSEDMFGEILAAEMLPSGWDHSKDRAQDVMYGGLTHDRGFADAQGLTSIVSPSHSGNTYFVGHDQGLYDWTMDPFDMNEAQWSAFMTDESGFVPGPYEGDVDFNFAGDFGVDPDDPGGIYGGEGN